MGIPPTESLLWGLMMMVVGMGVVFALLLALMLVLIGIGRLDRQEGEKLTGKPKVDPEEKMLTIHPDAEVPDGEDAGVRARRGGRDERDGDTVNERCPDGEPVPSCPA